MKRIITIAAGLLLTLSCAMLTGCPKATKSKVANAVLTASTVIKDFQQSEITSHQQGLISDTDHQFIEQELGNVAIAGKALDSCVASATNSAGDVACISTTTTAIGQINAAGGLGIKSAQAKQDFQAAMSAFNVALASVSAILGGGQ